MSRRSKVGILAGVLFLVSVLAFATDRTSYPGNRTLRSGAATTSVARTTAVGNRTPYPLNAVPTPNPYVFDTFSRADGGLGSTEGGTAGIQAWSGAGQWGVTAGMAGCLTCGDASQTIAYVDAGVTDVAVQARLSLPNYGAEEAVVGHFSDNNNYAACMEGQGGIAQIYEVVGGAYSMLAQANPFVMFVDDVLRCEFDGTAITLKVNGVLELATTSSNNLTNTNVGLLGSSVGFGDRYDDFYAQSLVDTVPTLPTVSLEDSFDRATESPLGDAQIGGTWGTQRGTFAIDNWFGSIHALATAVTANGAQALLDGGSTTGSVSVFPRLLDNGDLGTVGVVYRSDSTASEFLSFDCFRGDTDPHCTTSLFSGGSFTLLFDDVVPNFFSGLPLKVTITSPNTINEYLPDGDAASGVILVRSFTDTDQTAPTDTYYGVSSASTSPSADNWYGSFRFSNVSEAPP